MTTKTSAKPSLQSLACEAVNTNNKIRQYDETITKLLQFIENFQSRFINVANEDIPEQERTEYDRIKKLIEEHLEERNTLAQKAKKLFEEIRDYNKGADLLPSEDQGVL